VHLDLGGYPVTLLDTAGIRETDDPVEREGVARARKRAGEADLVLWVEEAGADDGEIPFPPPAREARGGEGGRRSRSGGGPSETWLVLNKSDLPRAAPGGPDTRPGRGRPGTDQFAARFKISATAGEGVPELVAALTAYAAETFGSREPALVTRERQRKALEQAAIALKRAVSETREDILAEELRIAAQALGRLTGRVDVEDILDVIFRDFCIGK
jgi:tRNA modification GTPase